MKREVSVAEVIEVFKEIQEIKDPPGKILEIVKTEVPKVIGDYLSEIMQVELTRFLGRQPYERVGVEEENHRNGSYPRNITLKKIGRELVEAIENWRHRNLSLERFKYLFCDGVYFEIRITRSIEKVAVLVVIGVTEDGQKQVIGLQSGDKESAGCWRELFRLF